MTSSRDTEYRPAAVHVSGPDTEPAPLGWQHIEFPEGGVAIADRPALGTRARVALWPAGGREEALAAVDGEIARLDAAASRFRPDSEISRTSRPGNGTFVIGSALAEAIDVALAAARWTDGRVVPTAGAALISSGYDRDFALVPTDTDEPPPEPAPLPDWRAIELNGALLQIPPGMRLDLGATGKALGADRAAEAALGATRGEGGVLVSLGGDIATAGAPPLHGWPVVVTEREPTVGAEALAAAQTVRLMPAAQTVRLMPAGQTVRLMAGGLATSSTTRRRWRRAGHEMHHIIDPGTGAPASGPWLTASVVARTCVDANAAATAAIVAGSDAVAWLASVGLAARLVDRAGEVVRVGGWPASDGGPLRPSDAASAGIAGRVRAFEGRWQR